MTCPRCNWTGEHSPSCPLLATREALAIASIIVERERP